MAIRLDLVIEKGVTFRSKLQSFDDNDNVIEYTSCRMQIRPDRNSETVLMDLTTDNGRIILENQEIEIYIPSAETMVVNFIDAEYDLLGEIGGEIDKVAYGNVTTQVTVTR